MMISAPLMLVVPMREEAPRWMRDAVVYSENGVSGRRLYRCGTVPTMICGVGRHRAARTLRSTLKIFRPDRVLIAGWAGAIAPEIRLMDAVCPEEVIFEDGSKRFAFDEKMRIRIVEVGKEIKQGICVTASDMVDTSSRKRRLRSMFGATIVEMEGTGLMEVLRDENIPAAMLRVVTDTADEQIGVDIAGLPPTGKGRFIWGFRHPLQAVHFTLLLRNLRKASKKIDTMLPLLVEALM